jgi:hypothetical protein
MSAADAAGWGGFSADGLSAATSDAQSTADSQDANMSAVTDAQTTTDPSFSLSSLSLDLSDLSNMTDAQMEAALSASIDAATTAANAAATSSGAPSGATAGAATGSGTGAGAGVGAGTEGGGGGGLGGLAGGALGAIGELFGIGSANASTFGPATSGVADVLDGAETAAHQGQLASYLSNNPTAASVLSAYPSQMAALQATNNSMLGAQGQQSIYGSQPGYAATGSPSGGASLGQGPSSVVAAAPSAPASLTADEIFAMNNPLVDQIAITTPSTSASTATSSNPYGAIGSGPAGPGVAGLQGQYGTVAGPSTATSSNPYGAIGQGPAGPGVAGLQGQYGPVASSLGPAIDVASLNTYNLGPAVAAPSAPTVSSPTAMSSTSTQAQAPSYTGTDTGGGGGAFGGSLGGGSSTSPLPSVTPIVSSTNPVATSQAILRKYLGASSDPYRYGMGPERQYYGMVPTAAKGGYFDANQYFADGGMVQPLSPPTTPLVSAQPTMAFTDGAGSVGSIAQPPGLAPSDAYGSDAPHASPMAPSVAASVPTMQPGLATLAMPNVNAGPATSQVSQNPNVGYALGNSPLSNLTRS